MSVATARRHPQPAEQSAIARGAIPAATAAEAPGSRRAGGRNDRLGRGVRSSRRDRRRRWWRSAGPGVLAAVLATGRVLTGCAARAAIAHRCCVADGCALASATPGSRGSGESGGASRASASRSGVARHLAEMHREGAVGRGRAPASRAKNGRQRRPHPAGIIVAAMRVSAPPTSPFIARTKARARHAAAVAAAEQRIEQLRAPAGAGPRCRATGRSGGPSPRRRGHRAARARSRAAPAPAAPMQVVGETPVGREGCADRARCARPPRSSGSASPGRSGLDQDGAPARPSPAGCAGRRSRRAARRTPRRR